jgi:tetratricopeptide (TPR) repeat protein
LTLDALSSVEALSLFRKIAGAERIDFDRQAAESLANACGYLPLAVRIAGARLADQDALTVGDLVHRLSIERQRLDELTIDDLDVRSTFLTSYAALGREQKRLFRFLGVFPGPTFAAWSTSALLGIPPGKATRALEELVVAQLVDEAGIDETGAARYRLHDLVRDLAREQHEAKDRQQSGDVLLRLLGAYIAIAAQAEDVFQPGEIRKRSSFPRYDFELGYKTSLVVDPPAWFSSERPALMGCIELAHECGHWDAVWELTHILSPFFEMTATWDDWSKALALALDSSERSADPSARAVVQFDSAALHRDRGALDKALACYSAALAGFSSVGDLHGIGLAHLGRALIFRNRREWDQVDIELTKSWNCFQSTGEKRVVAQVLRNFGIVRDAQIRFEESSRYFEDALQRFKELGDRRAEAYTWRGLGNTNLHNGILGGAIQAFENSLALTKALGDRRGEARALQGLGRTLRAQESFTKALEMYSTALIIAKECNDASLILELKIDIAEIGHTN